MGNKVKRQNFDPTKATIKLVVWDNHNTQHTMYNFISENKLGTQKIIFKMKERLLRKYFKNQFRNAIFYDTVSGNELDKVSNPNTILSKVKLVVYQGERKITRYSTVEEEKLTRDFTVGAMMQRVLLIEFKNDYRIGIFFDTSDNTEITYMLGKQSKEHVKKTVEKNHPVTA